MTTMQDLATPCSVNWCAGCGNIPLWAAFKQAAVEKDWNNNNSTLVAGIGCHGHIINFTRLTSFEGLHGRPLPVASGIKMANNRLNVFVFTGDGDCLGEGGNHFLHSCRRNHDITVFLHDNGLYALTTGQTSPASPHGYKSKSTPDGNLDMPIQPVSLAIAAGASFVARAYAGDIQNVKKLMIAANEHKGFALLDILQPCETFNKLYTHKFYQENTYHLGEDYDPTDKLGAYAKSLEFGEESIALGVIYKSNTPSYESQIPQIADMPLVDNAVSKRNTEKIFKHYM